ncbi:hypothetical protein RUM43_000266 [Polyplax serrata]|uniref:Uncharacterized protein n=1 Tax=Polyplax serrata TaxID=468196 RepID=A0AAN8SDS5_POLSC
MLWDPSSGNAVRWSADVDVSVDGDGNNDDDDGRRGNSEKKLKAEIEAELQKKKENKQSGGSGQNHKEERHKAEVNHRRQGVRKIILVKSQNTWKPKEELNNSNRGKWKTGKKKKIKSEGEQKTISRKEKKNFIYEEKGNVPLIKNAKQSAVPVVKSEGMIVVAKGEGELLGEETHKEKFVREEKEKFYFIRRALEVNELSKSKRTKEKH